MTGKIYFVSAPGRIKIGYTKKPEIRLAQLRAVDMEPIETLAIIDGTRQIERALHDLVRTHCIRGEWFADCVEVRRVIDEFLSGEITFDYISEAAEERRSITKNDLDFVDKQIEMHRAAIGEATSLIAEIERRVARHENVSDLVRSACFLAKHIIAPI